MIDMIVDELIAEGKDVDFVEEGREVVITDEMINRMTTHGNRARALDYKHKFEVGKKMPVQPKHMWGFAQQRELSMEEVRKEDGRRLEKTCRKRGFHNFTDRCYNDPDFLRNMCLRELSAQRPELQDPWYQSRAREVAERLGVLASILAFADEIQKGSATEFVVAESCKAMTVMSGGSRDWPLILIILSYIFVFFLGAVGGSLVKWCCKRWAPTTRSIAVQSQTTYTFKVGTPRFKPLPENAHGANVE